MTRSASLTAMTDRWASNSHVREVLSHILFSCACAAESAQWTKGFDTRDWEQGCCRHIFKAQQTVAWATAADLAWLMVPKQCMPVLQMILRMACAAELTESLQLQEACHEQQTRDLASEADLVSPAVYIGSAYCSYIHTLAEHYHPGASIASDIQMDSHQLPPLNNGTVPNIQ